jgi:CRP-like cAMP-binding protein
MPDITEYLRRLEAFKDLSPRECSTLSTVLEARAVRAGDYVCRQGEKGTGFYIVVEGKIATIKELGPRMLEMVSVLGPGDMGGLLSMFDRMEHFTSLRAVTNAVVLECSRDSFERLFESQSLFSYKIIDKFVTSLSATLRDSNDLVSGVFSDPKRTLLKLNQSLLTARKRLTGV